MPSTSGIYNTNDYHCCCILIKSNRPIDNRSQARIQGGGLGGQDAPPPFFGGPENVACMRAMLRVLVVNSYLPPPPFLKSCIRPCYRVWNN